MTREPFPWRKLTPAQIDLIERLVTADGALAYDRLEYRELLALSELQKLGFVDTGVKGRRKLEVYLTPAGRELQAQAYVTEQIVLRVTGPQIDFMRGLLDSPIDDRVGLPMSEFMGIMYDICRRMVLRGWVEWYERWDGRRCAKLTPAGREVLAAVGALDQTVIQFDEVRRRRGLL